VSRRESWVIQTLVRLLLELHYGISTGGVTLACDGLSSRCNKPSTWDPRSQQSPTSICSISFEGISQGVLYSGRVYTSEATRKTSKLGQILPGGNNKRLYGSHGKRQDAPPDRRPRANPSLKRKARLDSEGTRNIPISTKNESILSLSNTEWWITGYTVKG
jgi:hypothetical protein